MTANALTRAALVAIVMLGAPPATAGADGDPASDVLLNTDAFYPYRPVSTKVVRALDATIARARAAGYPIKVALIGSRSDLGAVPGLLGHPQRYADFLETEISFNGHPRLLVVMPQGLGLAAAGSRRPLEGIRVDRRGGSDALARAAIPAVAALARAAGHPFKPPAVPAGAGSRGGGGASLLVFAVPLALVALLAGASLLRRRETEPE